MNAVNIPLPVLGCFVAGAVLLWLLQEEVVPTFIVWFLLIMGPALFLVHYFFPRF